MDELVDKIVKYPLKSGVTLYGGDPFFQKEETLYLVKKLKENKINIWAYTGFVYEDLIKDSVWLETLKHIDVLVDGPFIYSEYDPLLKFRGSKNQRIIDVQKSLKSNEVLEMQL
jgi:anaerobic ribonucleoside-triphosphate reductase activating protein